MKKGLKTFRSKITVIMVTVVALISFVAFYFYNYSISKIIHEEHNKNTISALTLLKSEFYSTLGKNEGKIIYTIMDSAVSNKNVQNAYLLNSKYTLVYPKGLNQNTFDSLYIKSVLSSNNSIVINSVGSGKNKYNRVFIPMQNTPACYQCHPQSINNIGTIIVDFLPENSIQSIVYTRKFSFFFTLTMLLFLGGIIMFIHYKFIRKALNEFYSTINAVNQGDLYKRLSIPETKELGQLGLSFNLMLDKFQNTQNELQIFHKNELRNNYKLATIGEMASRLAHEIRNPITGIANAIEIINSENNDDKNKSVLNEVQRQANRVNNAITDLLKFSRQKDINLQESDINGLIKSLVFFLENHAHNKQITFKLELQEDLPIFKFDYAQIEDVLLNLGINAIQSIQKTGIITFKTNYVKTDKWVKISVCDTGKGIPENLKSKIFHPFFTTRNEGTGLGLAIVKDIIDIHNGDIKVENNSGEGCTFFIFLPVERV
ncbi:MAG TPA: ATP-binding protein [Draconibacterium sp.]|nr:ATP-binding protein [Draconibacterium sp.]